MNSPSSTMVGNSSAIASQRSSSNSMLRRPRGARRSPTEGAVVVVALIPDALPRGTASRERVAAPLPRHSAPVDPRQLRMRLAYRLFGWHALHRFRIHVGDDVLRHDLRRLGVRGAGITWHAAGTCGIAVGQHHRILVPDRVLLPD